MTAIENLWKSNLSRISVRLLSNRNRMATGHRQVVNNTQYIQNSNHDVSAVEYDDLEDSPSCSPVASASACAFLMFSVTVMLAMVPAIYVAVKTGKSYQETYVQNLTGGTEALVSERQQKNFTVCWPCKDKRGCCKDIQRSSPCQTSLVAKYSGSLACADEDIGHMLMTSTATSANRNCTFYGNNLGIQTGGWKRLSENGLSSQTFDEIRIPHRGLFMFYVRVSFNCKIGAKGLRTFKLSLAAQGGTFGSNPKEIATTVHRPTNADDQEFCYHGFLMATIDLYADDVVYVCTDPITSVSKESYFGFYRVG